MRQISGQTVGSSSSMNSRSCLASSRPSVRVNGSTGLANSRPRDVAAAVASATAVWTSLGGFGRRCATMHLKSMLPHRHSPGRSAQFITGTVRPQSSPLPGGVVAADPRWHLRPNEVINRVERTAFAASRRVIKARGGGRGRSLGRSVASQRRRPVLNNRPPRIFYCSPRSLIGRADSRLASWRDCRTWEVFSVTQQTGEIIGICFNFSETLGWFGRTVYRSESQHFQVSLTYHQIGDTVSFYSPAELKGQFIQQLNRSCATRRGRLQIYAAF